MTDTATSGEAVTCACGSQIGTLYIVQDGTQLLQIGGVLVKEAHSMFCVHCGRQIHWSVSDRQAERRIKRQLKARADA